MNALHPVMPVWRRRKPPKSRDMNLLKPPSLSKNERFETVTDAGTESLRSEGVLEKVDRASRQRVYLHDCRAGHYHCEQTYCPLCARDFRRWFIGEALRVVNLSHSAGHVMTVLLAKSHNIHDLNPTDYRPLIRRRLAQAGLQGVPVIGGFEIVYRAQDKSWILHINLLFLGGINLAFSKFETLFASNQFVRPTQTVQLTDSPEQLSYLLKFTTYHRPFRQTGPKRSPAKPLNAREHVALIIWMSQFQFTDMVFLHRVRREGDRLKVTAEPDWA
jgi:hypothetical protein